MYEACIAAPVAIQTSAPAIIFTQICVMRCMQRSSARYSGHCLCTYVLQDIDTLKKIAHLVISSKRKGAKTREIHKWFQWISALGLMYSAS